MTIDEMIRQLKMQGENDENNWVCVLSGHEADAIIAALRAGQKMRASIKKNVTGTPVQINEDAYKAAQAWDDATEESK